jgi:hypothetical protein
MDLGSASFAGLTRVKSRVRFNVFEFMKFTVKTQINQTQSYSRRPETPRPVRGSVFRAAQFHMARPTRASPSTSSGALPSD